MTAPVDPSQPDSGDCRPGLLEVCVDTVPAAVAAEAAGAERLELCAALDVGGVTPTRSFVTAVRARVACPIVALVRPRTGNFVYDSDDSEVMLAEVRELIGSGIDGLVVGGVTARGELDIPLLQKIRQQVPSSMQLVMHRAFDYVVQTDLALEQLIALGFARVLTAGGPGLASEFAVQLRRLVQYSMSRITIMPGGGVNPTNAARLLDLTGCRQLHGSFRLAGPATVERAFGSDGRLDVAAIAQVRQLIKARNAQR